MEFARAAVSLRFPNGGELKIGGNYVPVVRHGEAIYVSGEIPRVGDTIAVTGRAGSDVTVAQAQWAAKICILRALSLLKASLGSLSQVQSVMRMTVIIQCAQDFTQHSEVADGASELLYAVMGPVGVQTRTSLGAYRLPKNATVEVDLVAASIVPVGARDSQAQPGNRPNDA
ncbi:hypothetical protein ASC95_18015 [Pelomonas sp. Root1217]|nr:hypothetical protein ASC95_18015 [Pelomonas sp. Root1217]